MILVFEAIGATTSFLYGLNHLFYTINDDVPKEVRYCAGRTFNQVVVDAS